MVDWEVGDCISQQSKTSTQTFDLEKKIPNE